MAGYTGTNTGQNSQKDLSFRELMALLYGQGIDECGFPIKNTNPPVQSADWLDKFEKNSGSATNKLIGDLPLLNPSVTGIEITNNEVKGDLTGKPEERLFKAFAMGVTAMASKNMRDGGVTIDGDTVIEQAFLLIAAHFLGLKVNNETPEMQKKAQEIAQSTDISALWKEFSSQMDALKSPNPNQNPAPAPAPNPSSSSGPTGQQPPNNKPPTGKPPSTGQSVPPPANNKNTLHPDLLDALSKYMGKDSFASKFPSSLNITDKDLEKHWNHFDDLMKQGFLEDHALDHIGLDGQEKPAPTPKDKSKNQKITIPPDLLAELLKKKLREHLKEELAYGDENVTDEMLAKFWDDIGNSMKQRFLEEIHKDYASSHTASDKQETPASEETNTEPPEEDHSALNRQEKPMLAPEGKPEPELTPEETTEPEVSPKPTLTEIFNREVPRNVKTLLTLNKIDENDYKKISEAVIKDDDARGKTLKEKYKDDFNLTHKQLDNIVKAMDEEGITSKPERPGQARAVNYDEHGQPKNPTIN